METQPDHSSNSSGPSSSSIESSDDAASSSELPDPLSSKKRLLNKHEKQDVGAILDHLVTVGSKLASHPAVRGPIQSTAVEKKHQEDERLYSNSYHTLAGPDRINRKRNWEDEYGDGLNTLAFSDARLSRKDRRQEAVDGTNLSVETTVTTTAEEQVPRALLHRCWHRAVHAVATTISYDDLDKDSTSTENVEEEAPSFSSAAAITKWNALRLSLPNEGEPQACPSCHVVFDEKEHLHRHFFGAPNQRGCCWRVIDQKKHELLDEALQADVRATVQQILQLIASRINEKHGTTPLESVSWREVLGILSSIVVQSSKPAQLEEIIKTIQPNDWQQPIALNAAVMNAVRRRLIDRYDDLPR